jgi:hypothetical protein
MWLIPIPFKYGECLCFDEDGNTRQWRTCRDMLFISVRASLPQLSTNMAMERLLSQK